MPDIFGISGNLWIKTRLQINILWVLVMLVCAALACVVGPKGSNLELRYASCKCCLLRLFDPSVAFDTFDHRNFGFRSSGSWWNSFDVVLLITLRQTFVA